ncbi:MAG TPA: hypothetical protein VEZ41_01425 [Allosphingosinicella sp.]|nr:hypothetical protein [Allosphingosinicella sp.]
MSERQWVTAGLFALAGSMFAMALLQPGLWEVQLFGLLLQAVVISGIIGLVAGFHFAANLADEKRADNTGKAFDAIKAAQEAPAPPPRNMAAAAAGQAADAVEEAAQV